MSTDPKQLLEKKRKAALLEEKIRREARRQADKDELARSVWELSRKKVSDIVLAKPERLFGNRFERGAFNFIVGQGEVGKGMISMDIVARFSTGEPFPGENGARRPMKVLMCVVEDSENEIAGRLAAAGADTKNVELISGPLVMRGGLEMVGAMKLDSDAGPLVKLAKDEKFEAIFVETMVEHFGDREERKRISTNTESEVRGALSPFRAICRAGNMYGWALIHPRKGTSGEVSDLISGSAAFYNVPRLTMYVFKDPKDSTTRHFRRLLCCGKANNLSERPSTLRFRIDAWDRDNNYGRTEWGTGEDLEDERTVEEVLDEINENKSKRRDTKQEVAEKFLRTILADGKEHKPSEIKEAAFKAGITWSAILRAKTALGIKSDRAHEFQGGVSGWLFEEDM
jgi:RecA-family ATPase